MSARILTGDARQLLATLPDASVQMVCTSPPYYGLRSYGIGTENGEIGLEQSPDAYVAELVAVFREVRRVLADTGTCWINLGDSYANVGRQEDKRAKDASGVERPRAERLCERCGCSFVGGLSRRFCSAFCGGVDNSNRAHRPGGLKAKDLLGIPWMVAFALRADGWWLRSDNIWAKPNPMPESVQGSHFSRHMVTITEYERLSGLPYVDECAGDGWASDVPSLSETEVSGGEAPLPSRSGVEGDCAGGQGSLLLLLERDEGRAAHKDERRAGMRALQLAEEQQDDPSRLVPCPGCDKCAQHNGYTFHLSAGRPTSAHEHVFLLTKRASYFYDSVAVAEDATFFRNAERPIGTVDKENPDRNDGGRMFGYPGTRNLRNVWTIPTSPTPLAHFACMPPDLASICVRAGSSERGQCPHCVGPWARVVERTTLHGVRGGDGHSDARAVGTHEDRDIGGGTNWRNAVSPVTTGWLPTCACPEHKPVPQTVLDPFSGAGTSLLVADRLGRNGIGIELNPEYAAMSRERLRGDCPLFAEVA